MKVYISQPVSGLSNESIAMARKKAVDYIWANGDDCVNPAFTALPPEQVNVRPVKTLGKSIEKLGEADAILMVGNWKDYRGCRCENYVAVSYGLRVMEFVPEFGL